MEDSEIDVEPEADPKACVDQNTIEDVPDELTVKHPLENVWSLWFYKNDRSKSWSENLMEITSFNTVEDFWAAWVFCIVLLDGNDPVSPRTILTFFYSCGGLPDFTTSEFNKKLITFIPQGHLCTLLNCSKMQMRFSLNRNFLVLLNGLLYNHIELVSKLPPGCDYALFKQGIKPMWEDNRNKQGGRWLMNIMKQQRNTDLNNYWLEMLLCMIGEAFEEFSDEICGAVVQIRPKGDKLGLWTADVKNNDAIMKIGQIMKERLNIHPRTLIAYEAHSDTQTKTGSSAKSRFTL